MLRVLKLWTQTILAPVASSFLFILVFGLSLGGRIKQVEGVEYEVFIVPGLVTMAMVQAAYSNNAASVFQARFDRYINDVLAAPMRAWEINLGLSLGGVVRALLIGISLTALAIPVTSVPIRQPAELVLAVVLTLALFSSLGVIVGIYATSWDFTGFVNNLIILPLTFLGGVFYSVDVLPSPWHELSHANPIFYLVQTVRYGFLGTSDVSSGSRCSCSARWPRSGRLELLALRDRPAPEALTARRAPAARLADAPDVRRAARRRPRGRAYARTLARAGVH